MKSAGLCPVKGWSPRMDFTLLYSVKNLNHDINMDVFKVFKALSQFGESSGFVWVTCVYVWI